MLPIIVILQLNFPLNNAMNISIYLYKYLYIISILLYNIICCGCTKIFFCQLPY